MGAPRLSLKLTIFILFQLASLVAADCTAQPLETPGLAGSSSFRNAIQYYQSSAGAQSIFYSGIVHKGYTADIQGTAYFLSEDWQIGQIYFDNILFDNVPVLYDQVTDEVLTLTPGKVAIRLVSERTNRFLLSGHTFVRIGSADNSMAGFYDLIRDGATAVLVKRKKIIKESLSGEGLSRKFLSEDKHYLRKGDGYFQIRSMKNVLDALGDKKSEIRQLFKDRKVDLKSDPEGALTEIAAHYDKLNNSL